MIMTKKGLRNVTVVKSASFCWFEMAPAWLSPLAHTFVHDLPCRDIRSSSRKSRWPQVAKISASFGYITLKTFRFSSDNDDDDDDVDEIRGGGGGSELKDTVAVTQLMSSITVKFLDNLLISVVNTCRHKGHALGWGNCIKQDLHNVCEHLSMTRGARLIESYSSKHIAHDMILSSNS